MPDKNDGLFIFPYYAGPAIRPFSVGLIWSGKLVVMLPGWSTNNPTKTFSEIGQYSSKINHPLEKLLATAWEYYNLASKQAMREIERLKELGDRLDRIIMLMPGGRQPYDSWRPIHKQCLPAISKTFENQQILNGACVGFIWRIYELFLELDENPDNVLEYLNARAISFGNPDYLLFESSLHHYALGKANLSGIITDSIDVLNVLNLIGSSFDEIHEKKEVEASQLAYFLFEALLGKYIPKLHPENIDRLLSILNTKNESIISAKNKCFLEANKIIDSSPKSDTKEIVTVTINNLKSEITEIVGLDSQAWKNLIKTLTEDRVFWTSIAGLIGTIAGSMPSVVPAAAAITALSSIGTTALKERRLRRERLQDSPWSLVYYLRNKN